MSLQKRGNSPKSGKNYSFRRICTNLTLGAGAITALGKAYVTLEPLLAPYAHVLLTVFNSWFL